MPDLDMVLAETWPFVRGTTPVVLFCRTTCDATGCRWPTRLICETTRLISPRGSCATALLLGPGVGADAVP